MRRESATWRGGRVVEGNRLLSGRTVKSCTEGSNPSFSAEALSIFPTGNV